MHRLGEDQRRENGSNVIFERFERNARMGYLAERTPASLAWASLSAATFEPVVQVGTIPFKPNVLSEAYMRNAILAPSPNLIPDPAFRQIPSTGELTRVDDFAGLGWGRAKGCGCGHRLVALQSIRCSGRGHQYKFHRRCVNNLEETLRNKTGAKNKK